MTYAYMYTHVYVVNTGIHTKSDTHVVNSVSVPTTKEKKKKDADCS